jgi:phage terminase large subunit-like protein
MAEHIGKNTRWGSGAMPASPLVNAPDDFYVMGASRTDEEYQMECDEFRPGLHYPWQDEKGE